MRYSLFLMMTSRKHLITPTATWCTCSKAHGKSLKRRFHDRFECDIASPSNRASRLFCATFVVESLDKTKGPERKKTVCCNHRESNPGLYIVEEGRFRQFQTPLMYEGSGVGTRRSRSGGVVDFYVPPAYCSCAQAVSVYRGGIRRQERPSRHLVTSTCDRSETSCAACVVLYSAGCAVVHSCE